MRASAQGGQLTAAVTACSTQVSQSVITCFQWCQHCVVKQALSFQVLSSHQVVGVPANCCSTGIDPTRSEGGGVNRPAQLLCNDQARGAAARCTSAVAQLAHNQWEVLTGPAASIITGLNADDVPAWKEMRGAREDE